MPSDLVLYLRMDEGSGSVAVDSSGYGNNGTLYNGASWVEGKFGSALSFDGIDDYVSIPSEYMKGLSQLTISLWFNTFALTGSRQILYMSPISSGVNGRVVLMIESDNKLFFGGRAPDTDPLTTWVDSTTTLTTNTWYHVVAIFDSISDVHSLYINGVAQTYTNVEPSLDNTNPYSSSRIGLSVDNEYPFHGTIDDVRIYSRALSADEIGYLYKIGSMWRRDVNVLI